MLLHSNLKSPVSPYTIPACPPRNCGSFLRVTSAGLPQLANLEFRQLDASRVHPESYRLAVSLCAKANGGEEDVEAAIEEAADKVRVALWIWVGVRAVLRLSSATVLRFIGSPTSEYLSQIERLDLIELAAEKEVPGKLSTLIDIRQV